MALKGFVLPVGWVGITVLKSASSRNLLSENSSLSKVTCCNSFLSSKRSFPIVELVKSRGITSVELSNELYINIPTIKMARRAKISLDVGDFMFLFFKPISLNGYLVLIKSSVLLNIEGE